MRLLLIGGKDVDNKSNKILEFIVNYKENPNILLIPAAAKDNDKSLKNLGTLFKDYKCNTKFLLLYKDPNGIDESLEWADILYFGGGNTKHLVDKVLEYNIDKYLRKCDKLIAGISAGMNMMALSGMGDSDSYQDNFHTYNYKMQKGIGLINYVVCPHYNMGDLEIFNDIPREYGVSGLALENDTALYIDDYSYYVIKDNKKRSVYRFIKEEDYRMESVYNKSIATLGPEGTFCDVACKDYLKSSGRKLNITYFPSIKKTIEGINELGIGVIPFENSLDGYVLEAIDNLIKNDYKIISELDERVEFAFVSNAKKIEDVKSVFVQFKAKAECIDFLTIKNRFNLIMTESNMISLNNLLKSDDTYGAIIPLHKASEYEFNINIKNISDRDSNFTRFVVVSKTDEPMLKSNNVKCSLCLFMNEDYPGILFDALKLFNEYKVNLNAIISRPTKEALGKYNFYIEISSTKDEIKNINDCIKAISMDDRYEIKNLGIYSR
ncbi:MAG: Type 1 glutamine amidotransferase-like domain-containing protein [Acholeplasmatales bacterium]|nr:Type 1 glutamine amidotransferase-like domain-containing protein [Acholeplasmatales bacterium]